MNDNSHTDQFIGHQAARPRQPSGQQLQQLHHQQQLQVDSKKEIIHNNWNLTAPSFLRLFVSARIIWQYMNDMNNKGGNSFDQDQSIKDLTNVFKDDHDVHTRSVANQIVTRLLNNGIKIYMKKWYNEKEQANIIEMIFNKIIVKKFEKEYNQLMTYKTDDRYYQDLVFNSSDLMCQIFEYLEWGYGIYLDLFSCSLVNSHWLYHSCNLNCVYFARLDKLMKKTIKYKKKEDNNVTRMWQRLIHAKSIHIRLNEIYFSQKELMLIMSKLSLLRYVERVKLEISINLIDCLIFQVLLSTQISKERIKHCDIQIQTTQYTLPAKNVSSLRLPNAKYIGIGDLYFYRIWSNKCTKLVLYDIMNINKDWCEFVIKYCDCCNINSLELNRICIGTRTYFHQQKTINESILKQLAFGFGNLKQLKIVINKEFDSNILLFWKYLHPIILKNNGKVELIFEDMDKLEFLILNRMMKQWNLNFDHLTINVDENINNHDNGATEFIQSRDNIGLKHLTIKCRKNFRLLYHILYKSIKICQVKADALSMGDMINFLGMQTFTQKQIFVIVDVGLNYSDNEDIKRGNFESLFKQLCQNICQLFTNKVAVAIDIKISSANAIIINETIYNSCVSIYQSCFQSKEFLIGYMKPSCTSVRSLCLPRNKPYSYLHLKTTQACWFSASLVMHATNVSLM